MSVAAPAETMSLRAYARHRKALGLPGGDAKAVRRAINLGLIPATALTNTGAIRDAEAADRAWEASKRSDRAPLSGPTAPKRGRGEGPVDYASARLRREVAEAEKAEIAVAQLKGQLVPATEVRAHMEADYAAVRMKVLGVPSRLRLADPTLSVDQVELVKRLLREALEDLAEDTGEAERATG